MLGARIIEVPAERHQECLDVLQAAFATDVREFGITGANTPSNPAFWTLAALERVVARPADLIAVEVSGRIVGCAFALPSASRPGTWELRHLGVLPEARHRGYGELLVAEVARRAAAASASRLRIGIVAANRRLARWYERLGFVTVGLERYPGLPFTVEHLEAVV